MNVVTNLLGMSCEPIGSLEPSYDWTVAIVIVERGYISCGIIHDKTGETRELFFDNLRFMPVDYVEPDPVKEFDEHAKTTKAPEATMSELKARLGLRKHNPKKV